MTALRWLSIALLALALVAGAAFLLQRQAAAGLSQEIALLQQEQRELARLRSENQRLLAAQVSAEELQRLRADRAALARLRTEIDALKARAEQRTREPVIAASEPAAKLRPALSLTVGVAANGQLSLDGNPINLEILKQCFSGVDKGERVEVRLRISEQRPLPDDIDRNMNGIMALAKDLGLKMTIGFDRPGAK